jgi:hypothetical protein
MLESIQAEPAPAAGSQRVDAGSTAPRAKSIYFSLLSERGHGPGQIDQLAFAASRAFLTQALQAVAALDCDLPDDPRSLVAWSEAATRAVGQCYREYLDARQAGAPRRYFSSKAHALYFLRGAAPTKLVDGAWLYGLLRHWDDGRFTSLIRTYLDELGVGIGEQNHVLMYRKLLAAHGCDRWDNLADDRFTQGAVHLSLAHHTTQFLPEVIGFNLGYERLPLHLLITAYELAELGIDPHYFRLHVTIDNVASGHGRKALQGVFDALPRVANADGFYRRVTSGYKLNLLGTGTESIIESFDPYRELLVMLRAKASIGSHLHSDYSRIGGRTVNDWLSSPDELPAFLTALEKMGWVRLHRDPRNSRFWKLLHGPNAPMFGVFDGYEQQLIHDWIAGAWHPHVQGSLESRLRPGQFTAGQRPPDLTGECADNPAAGDSPGNCLSPRARDLPSAQFPQAHVDDVPDDFNAERRLLEARLAASPRRQEKMAMLVGLMSPANHHTPAGLMATRVFAQLLR